MSSELQDLSTLLGDPSRAPGTVPWEKSNGEVAFDFPADFRWFIDKYGSVVINDLLHIWSPQKEPINARAEDDLSEEGRFRSYVRLSSTSGGQGQMRMRLRSRHPESQPYPVWPEPEGLILWGRNERRHQCFWWTKGGDSNKWPIVVWFSEFEWMCYQTNFCQFLVDLLRGNHELSDELIGERSAEVPILQQHSSWDD